MNGIVGYLYQSAKDSIKWHNKKPKDFMNLIMGIGRLVYLSDKDFQNIGIDNDISKMSANDVKNIYANFKKQKEK